MSADILYDDKFSRYYFPVINECRRIADRVLKIRYSRGRLIGVDSLQNEYAYAEFIGKDNPDITREMRLYAKLLSNPEDTYGRAFYGPDREGINPEAAATAFYDEYKPFLIDKLGSKIFEYLCLPYASILGFAAYSDDRKYRPMDKTATYREEGDIEEKQFYQTETNKSLAELFVENPIEALVNTICSDNYQCKALGALSNNGGGIKLGDLFIHVLNTLYAKNLWHTPNNEGIAIFTERLRKIAESMDGVGATASSYIRFLSSSDGYLPTNTLRSLIDPDKFGLFVYMFLHKDRDSFQDSDSVPFGDAESAFYAFSNYLMLLNIRCFEALLLDSIGSAKTQKEDESPDGGVVIVPVDVPNPVRETILNKYANIEDVTSNFDTYFTAMLQVCAKATSDAVMHFIKKEQMLTSKAADFITKLTDNNNPLVHAIRGKEVSIDERIATSLMGAEDSRVFSTAKEVFSEGRDCPIHFVLKDMTLEPEILDDETVYTNLEIYAEHALTTISEMLGGSSAAIVPILTFKLQTSEYSTAKALDSLGIAEYLLDKVDSSQVAKQVSFIQYNIINYSKNIFNERQDIDIFFNASLPDNVAIYFKAIGDSFAEELPTLVINNLGMLNVHIINNVSYISPQHRRDFEPLTLFCRTFPREEPPKLISLFGVYNIKKYAQAKIGRHHQFKKQVVLFSAKSAILKDINFIDGLAEGAKIITRHTTLLIPVNNNDNLTRIMAEDFWYEDVDTIENREMKGEIDVVLVLGVNSLGLSEMNYYNMSKYTDVLVNLYANMACKYGVVKKFSVVPNSERTSLFKQSASGVNINDFDTSDIFEQETPSTLFLTLHTNHILYGNSRFVGRPAFIFYMTPSDIFNNLDLDNEEYDYSTPAFSGLFNFTTNAQKSSSTTLISLKGGDASNATSLSSIYSIFGINDDGSNYQRTMREAVNSLLSQFGLTAKKGSLLLEKGTSGLASVYAFLFYNYLSCRGEEHFVNVFDINTMSSLVDALEMTSAENRKYGYSFQKLERAFANNIPFVLGYRYSASSARVPTVNSYLTSGTNLSIPKLLFSMADFYTRPVAILEDICTMLEARSNPFVKGESVISGVLHNTGNKPISLYTDALKRSQLNYEEWSISSSFGEYGDTLFDVPIDMLGEEMSRFYQHATIMEFDIIADMHKEIKDLPALTNTNNILTCALRYYVIDDEDNAIDTAILDKGFTEKDFPKWEVNTEYLRSFSSNVFDAFEEFRFSHHKNVKTRHIFNINKAESYEITPFEYKLNDFLRHFCEALLPYSDLYKKVYDYIKDPNTYENAFFNDINPQSREIPKIIDIFSNPDFPTTRSYTAISKPRPFGDALTTEIATKNSGISYALLSNIFSGTLTTSVNDVIAPEKKKRLLAHELLGSLALLEASRAEIYKVKAKPEEYGDIIYENESGYKLIQTHTAEGKLDKWNGIYERAKLLTQDHGGICIGQGEYYSREAANGDLQIFTIMSPDTILAVVGVRPKSNHPDEIKAYRNKTPAGLLPSESDYKKASKENILTTTKFVVDILKTNYEKRDVPPQTTGDLNKLIIAAAYHMGIKESVEDFDRFLAELITGVYDEELNKYGDYSAIKDKVV